MQDTQGAHAQAIGQAMGVGSGQGADFWRYFGDQAIQFGWSDDQLKQTLSKVLSANGNGQYSGQAGVLQNQFKQMASDYGVAISDDTIGGWVKQGVLGGFSAENARAIVSAQAASRYPAFADRLQGGETMRQIADPYVQSQAKLLELNPQTISLQDNNVQQALSSVGPDGKPAAKSVWQFEQDLRKGDPRWATTQNAQDSASQTAHKILSDFGMVS